MKLKDYNENSRTLTPAEQRRLAHFEEVRAARTAEGYRVTELTVGLIKANVYALFMAVPLMIVLLAAFIYFNRNREISFSRSSLPLGMVVFFIILMILFVIHELIHGLTWGIFADDHFNNIEFGFIKEMLTPYCTCSVPLKKGQYILGTLMPLIVLGMIPAVISVCIGSLMLLMIGFVMIIAAGGDILIAVKLLRYHSAAREVLIYDHPTKAGSVIFERNA